MPQPTRAELQLAAGSRVSDVIAPGLRILFCGINPGLYSGYTGHHFARPGNRFWPALHAAGFTDRVLRPEEERELLLRGYGITNLVERATAAAAELTAAELRAGKERLAAKVAEYRPAAVAVLGIGVFRLAFERPQAAPRCGYCRTRAGSTPITPPPNWRGSIGSFARRRRRRRRAYGCPCSFGGGDAGRGVITRTSVPQSGALRIVSREPTFAARSRID